MDEKLSGGMDGTKEMNRDTATAKVADVTEAAKSADVTGAAKAGDATEAAKVADVTEAEPVGQTGMDSGIVFNEVKPVADGAVVGNSSTIPVYANGWKPKPVPPVPFSGLDVGLAVGMLICGFLYWDLIRLDSLGAGVTIFAVLFCAAVGLYFRLSGLAITKESVFCAGIVLISSAYFTLFDHWLLKKLNFLLLMTLVIYWVCLYTKGKLEKGLRFSFLYDMLNHSLLVPFSNFPCCFMVIQKKMSDHKKGRAIFGILAGLLISLPILLMVISLLMQADAAFEGFMTVLGDFFTERFWENIFRFVLGIPVACYLYGLVYGSRHSRYRDSITLDSVEKNKIALRFFPGIPVYTALSALSLIYVVFFLTQAAYLFSAFSGILPEAMTYAEYARRGFFELCTVAGINLGVLVVAHITVKREGRARALRGLTTGICISTILLIAVALRKMILYIDSYGLTQLRVYTSWFMILLLVIFLTVAIRQAKVFNGTRVIIVTSLVLFFALCYGNVDGLIAQYNINRYQQGTLETLDVRDMASLSDAVVQPLYELYLETEDGALKAEIYEAIENTRPELRISSRHETSFRDFNLQTYRAEKIVLE